MSARRWWLCLFVVSGCEAREVAAEGAVGEPCGPGGPGAGCAAGLVCRDGHCRERGSVVSVAPELPPLVSFDVAAPHEADAADEASGGAVEVVEVEGDSSDVAESVTWLGEHEAASAPSDMRLSLGESQAAVRQFVVPAGGARRVLGLEAYTTSLEAAPACARYRLVVWLPDADGVFASAATWQSAAEVLLTEASGPQFAAAGEGAAELSPGPVRAGLAYLGPCPGTAFSPWLALDGSGDTTDSFVWAGNWIPGQSLALRGRWALRLAVGDGLP